MATITDIDPTSSQKSPRGHRLRWFLGLWLVSVLAVLVVSEVLRLAIGALYQL